MLIDHQWGLVAPEGNFTANIRISLHDRSWKNYWFKITTTSPRGQLIYGLTLYMMKRLTHGSLICTTGSLWGVSINKVASLHWVLIVQNLFALYKAPHRHMASLKSRLHYSEVIMTTVASQIIRLVVVYSIVYLGADERKHQSSASLAFVRGIHRDWWIPHTKGQ